MTQITRHFATIDGRYQMHYRRGGEGPPIVLIHQSPNSSRDFIDLIGELAGLGFTVIAPDVPGNAQSDPIPGEPWPSMADFADSIAALMTQIGLEQAAVHGFHFGAVCALELAARHPAQVTAALVEGYVHMAEAQRQDMLANYLETYPLHWSGAHLVAVWARYREQSIFFPWHAEDDARRLERDLPSAATIQSGVMDFLMAGDNYRQAYRAAFLYDPGPSVLAITAPTQIITSITDVMAQSVALMPTPPANVRILSSADRAEARRLFVQGLVDHPAPEAAPPIRGAAPMPGRIWRDYLQVEGGSLLARRNGEGEGRPLVMIHPPGGSSAQMVRHMTPILGHRPLLAVDLPGQGDSDWVGEAVSVEDQAGYLAQAVAAAGYDLVDVLAAAGGCSIGVELARQRPDLVGELALLDLESVDPADVEAMVAWEAGPLSLDDNGLHWIKAWNQLRDAELFAPWNRRDKGAVRRGFEPDIGPEAVHQRAMDLFKCADRYRAIRRAQLLYPVVKRLGEVKAIVRREK